MSNFNIEPMTALVAVTSLCYGLMAAGVFTAIMHDTVHDTDQSNQRRAAWLIAIVWPIFFLYRLGYQVTMALIRN